MLCNVDTKGLELFCKQFREVAPNKCCPGSASTGAVNTVEPLTKPHLRYKKIVHK